MKNPVPDFRHSFLRAFLCMLATVTLAVRVAQAHPYASGVSVSAGTVSYILNENANDVSVVFYFNGAQAGTTDYGALTKGAHSFSLGTNTSFAVIVNNIGSGAITETESSTNLLTYFNGPRGVAVNMNAESTNFGRIYVVNASAGTPTAGRTTAKGLFALNADQSDAFGYANTAQTGGIKFGGSGTYSPYKLTVGPDDMVYVGDADGNYDNVSPLGYGIWMVNPNLSFATNLFTQDLGPSGTSNECGGIISTPYVTGSYAASNLVVQAMPWDAYGGQMVLQWNIGNSPLPYTGDFTTNAADDLDLIPGVTADMAVGTNGFYYLLEFRNTGASTDPCIEVVSNSPAGPEEVWNSYNVTSGFNGGVDAYNIEYGIAVTPDQRYMVTIISSEGVTVTPLINGIPQWNPSFNYCPPNLPYFPAGSAGTARGIGVDAADNIYTVSGGSDRLRVYSLGLTTTCVTSNDASGAHGRFSFSIPNNSISVLATNNVTAQNTPGSPGVFVLTRSSGAGTLTVDFALGGTATNGVYTVSPAGITAAATNTITFAAGQTTTNITITAVNDGKSRLETTVVLSLLGGATYTVGSPNSDTVSIVNNGPEVLQVASAAAPSMYKAFTNDYASFYVVRLGDTNNNGNPLTVNFSFAGTAVSNVDYLVGPTVTFNPGDITNVASVSPKTGPTGFYTGNKTIIPSVAAGSGYTAGPGTATLTLIDNADPPATILFSDPLTEGSDSNNWAMTFANDDMGDPTGNYANNFQYVFGYDLTNPTFTPGYPVPLPPSGATTALFVTVNKVGSTGASGAQGGINLYPTNVSFSGSYAVRFDMNLIEGYSLAFDTEGAMFGINHNGKETNWWVGSAFQSTATNIGPFASDGFWYWIDGQSGGAGSGDFIAFTGNGSATTNGGWKFIGNLFAASFTNAFKASSNNAGVWSPGIYSAEAEYGVAAGAADPGIPANYSSTAGGDETNWSNVEIKQVVSDNGGDYYVTMSINKTVVFAYTNTTGLFTNGTLMLGYEDAFDSIGSDSAVYYSNLRVVRLGPPSISSVGTQGGNIVINFTSVDAEDSASSFVLQSTTSLKPPISWSDVSPAATFTQDAVSGIYTATSAKSGPVRFYRVRHK